MNTASGSSSLESDTSLVSPTNPDLWVYNTDELIRYPNDASNPLWCGHTSKCTSFMKQRKMKGLLIKLGVTTDISPLLRRIQLF